MLYLFVSRKNSRIHYIMNLIWERILGANIHITSDKEEFSNYGGPKISYADSPIANEIHIQSVSLLFENEIKPQPIVPVEWNGLRLFFPTPTSLFPFDPFAVSFYLVTRYEEYLTGIDYDEHGRFRIQDSVAYRQGFHRIPVVNIIAEALAEAVREQFPEWEYQRQEYRFLPTFDVDIAYRYKGKTPLRFCGSLAKAALHLDGKSIKNLFCSLVNLPVNDDFDTFENHKRMAEKYNVRPIHFILTAPFGKFDRNIDYRSEAFRKLILQLQEFSAIGLHPSYYTSEQPELFSEEKARLEEIVGMPITHSRQHFLKVRFPGTFDALDACGIRDDYSLGWPDEAGFRASITTPFPFYNLEKECETQLMLHPLHIMDGALMRCCKGEEEYAQVTSVLRERVEQHGGEFVTLQHNSAGKQISALQ